MITTVNPLTGAEQNTGIHPTRDVAAVADRARLAAQPFAAMDRLRRADLLVGVADALESHGDDLAAVAVDETGLEFARLRGEVSRSAVQFRMFADVVRDGTYLEAMVDHALNTAPVPAPDVRRSLIPLGPIAVFGSSNFPFAFSVAGGDVASAFAAGCPVVVKAHSSHPLTSQRSFEVIEAALVAGGAPDGTFGIVFGQAAGRALVAEPAIRAVGFTGSLPAARALQDAIDERDEPIPFFGELSSLNPLVITEAALRNRGEEIAAGLFASVTGSAGQLCTKPGVVVIPDGSVASAFLAELRRSFSQATGQTVLNSRILAGFKEISAGMDPSGVATTRGPGPSDTGFTVAPTLIEATASEFSDAMTEECFGPLVVVVRAGSGDVAKVIERLPNSLTATIHHEDEDREVTADLVERLVPKAGRLIFNGFPTGVRVSWAQHHGGPWPATNSQHTSVGATAVRRFQRPLAWQGAPSWLLPTELRDGEASVPRRVDGTLE